MNLEELNAVPEQRKQRKRVGRGPGSGHGKTAGRGTKGQKSRSGYARRMGFEGGQMPLYRRLPKKGFSNALFKVRYEIVNTGQLGVFDEGAVVDLAALKEARLVKARAERVKVLGKGALTKKLEVRADRFSQTARQMIEAAGGTATEVASR